MLGGDGDSNPDWCHDVRTNVLLPLHLIPPGLCPGEKSQKLGFQFSRFTIQSRNSIRGLAAGTISLVCVGRKNAGRLGTRMWGLIWVRSCAGLAQHCWAWGGCIYHQLTFDLVYTAVQTWQSQHARERLRESFAINLCHYIVTHELSRICQSLWGEKLKFLSKICPTLQLSRQQAPGSPTTTMTHPEIFQTTPNNYPAPAVGGGVATATTSYLGRRDNLWCELFVIVCIACYFKMIYHKKKCPQPNNFEFIITKWPCCVLIIPG